MQPIFGPMVVTEISQSRVFLPTFELIEETQIFYNPSKNHLVIIIVFTFFLFSKDDRKEGMTAFVEKRKAEFTDN